MPYEKVTQYADLEVLISQAESWEGANGRKLTTFAKRFDRDPQVKGGAVEYAVACGNMGWRGTLDDAQSAKLERWLKSRSAITVEGVATLTELFE